MRWLTIKQWEDTGGSEWDEPATFVYVKHPEHGGLRVLAYWDTVDKEWVCEDDGQPVEMDGFNVTHVLEVTDPVGV